MSCKAFFSGKSPYIKVRIYCLLDLNKISIFFLRIMQFSSNCALYRMRFEVKCAKPHHRIISEALSCATTAKKCTKKHDMMHMQNCCFGNINLLLFCCSRCLHHHPSFLLLWSRNFATMVTWCHACESDSPCNCCGNYKINVLATNHIPCRTGVNFWPFSAKMLAFSCLKFYFHEIY